MISSSAVKMVLLSPTFEMSVIIGEQNKIGHFQKNARTGSQLLRWRYNK